MSDMLANINPFIFLRSKTSKPNLNILKWPAVLKTSHGYKRLTVKKEEVPKTKSAL